MEKLSLYYPVRPLHFNQLFGVKSPLYPDSPGHNGIDFMATHGQPIHAAHDGLAIYQIDGGGGHGVVVVTNDQFDYNGVPTYFKTIFWHLPDSLKEPQYRSFLEDKTGFTPVKRGQIIGYADNTGLSTGDHLHFGLKPVAKGEAWGTWSSTEQNNGYGGAIDPMPYFNGKFADEDAAPTPYLFTRDLHLEMIGDDVKKLQKYLNTHGYPLAQTGDGSPGHETTYFGPLTQHAVMTLQQRNNIYPSVGYFGSFTRAFINNHS